MQSEKAYQLLNKNQLKNSISFQSKQQQQKKLLLLHKKCEKLIMYCTVSDSLTGKTRFVYFYFADQRSSYGDFCVFFAKLTRQMAKILLFPSHFVSI